MTTPIVGTKLSLDIFGLSHVGRGPGGPERSWRIVARLLGPLCPPRLPGEARMRGDVKHKAQMLKELETMLRDVFAARAEGTSHPRMARAHGYVDGYMRALLETGIATKSELLALVAEQRTRVHGPATRELLAVSS